MVAVLATALLPLHARSQVRRSASFVFSVTLLEMLTRAPLPDPTTMAGLVPGTDLVMEPFRLVRLFHDTMQTVSLRPAFFERLNVAAAVSTLLLCIVIGWSARPVLRSPFSVGVLGIGLSLFVQLTQLMGTWSLHPCPYRLFDVDDLILHTLAAAAVAWTWHARRSARERLPEGSG